MRTNTVCVDIANNEEYYFDTQKTPLYIEPIYPDCDVIIKKNAFVINPNSTSVNEEENMEISLYTTTISPSDYLENRFEVLESLFGYINYVDKETLSFTITVKDDSDNIFDMYLSNLDVEKNDTGKIRVGARLAVLYGFEYKNGTARKRTKIVFRTVNRWNNRKIDIYKNGFKSEQK